MKIPNRIEKQGEKPKPWPSRDSKAAVFCVLFFPEGAQRHHRQSRLWQISGREREVGMKGSLRKETTGSPLMAPLPFGVKPSPTVICHLSRTRLNREGRERPGKAIHGEIRGREERGRAEARRVEGG